ncbi:hypothetical protein PAXINDRAFT_12149 [Paxillus involutus ATCC 200175]|uniref:Uncharacterized protein n=1 Tax=Paxillus involutus ATCC 200175 TaxID=664439 RepID=A0A0C9U833_PAXIN|nr:hypothetical protein PAXINDRAFT_12149 [Paxillus involutus ATCC 200175]
MASPLRNQSTNNQQLSKQPPIKMSLHDAQLDAILQLLSTLTLNHTQVQQVNTAIAARAPRATSASAPAPAATPQAATPATPAAPLGLGMSAPPIPATSSTPASASTTAPAVSANERDLVSPPVDE